MAENEVNLLADVTGVRTKAWMDKIKADRKGADFNKKLVWRTNEGFNVMPFYRAEDIANLHMSDAAPGDFPYVRGTKKNNEWFVRQNMKVTDAKEANAKMLDLMGKGVTSFGMCLDVEKIDTGFVVTLLTGIDPQTVELNFYCCMSQMAELLELLTAYYASNGYDASKLKGSVNCDPIKRMLTRGRSFTKEEVATFVTTTANAGQNLPKYKSVTVESLALNNSGAYCAQELGYALAWGNQYLEMMVENGVSAAVAANAIKFNMGIGSNYFMEIAKFRAARWLWAMIVRSYNPASDSAAKLNIYAATSFYNKTIYDAHVNMLRPQTEAMSAAWGGVNSMTVNPYDHQFKCGGEFA